MLGANLGLLLYGEVSVMILHFIKSKVYLNRFGKQMNEKKKKKNYVSVALSQTLLVICCCMHSR